MKSVLNDMKSVSNVMKSVHPLPEIVISRLYIHYLIYLYTLSYLFIYIILFIYIHYLIYLYTLSYFLEDKRQYLKITEYSLEINYISGRVFVLMIVKLFL